MDSSIYLIILSPAIIYALLFLFFYKTKLGRKTLTRISYRIITKNLSRKRSYKTLKNVIINTHEDEVVLDSVKLFCFRFLKRGFFFVDNENYKGWGLIKILSNIHDHKVDFKIKHIHLNKKNINRKG